MTVHCEKFIIVFIIKLMELPLKIEMSHFIVSYIVATRQVITLGMFTMDKALNFTFMYF